AQADGEVVGVGRARKRQQGDHQESGPTERRHGAPRGRGHSGSTSSSTRSGAAAAFLPRACAAPLSAWPTIETFSGGTPAASTAPITRAARTACISPAVWNSPLSSLGGGAADARALMRTRPLAALTEPATILRAARPPSETSMPFGSITFGAGKLIASA